MSPDGAKEIKTKWFDWSYQVECVLDPDFEPRNTTSIDGPHTVYISFFMQDQ